MKYEIKTAGHIREDYKANTETAIYIYIYIIYNIYINRVLHKIQECCRNCLQHTNGSPGNRLLIIVKSYRPTGRRNQGRPLKRLWMCETGTGQQVAELHVSLENGEDD